MNSCISPPHTPTKAVHPQSPGPADCVSSNPPPKRDSPQQPTPDQIKWATFLSTGTAIWKLGHAY